MAIRVTQIAAAENGLTVHLPPQPTVHEVLELLKMIVGSEVSFVMPNDLDNAKDSRIAGLVYDVCKLAREKP